MMEGQAAFMRALCDAMGLPHSCTRIVIEADMRSPIRVYYTGFPRGHAAFNGIVKAVESVTVGEKGEVTIVDHTPETNRLPPA